MSPAKSKRSAAARPAPASKRPRAAKAHKSPEADARPRRKRGSAADSRADSRAEAPAPEPAPRRARGGAAVDLADALLHALETSERVNQFLLEKLDPAIWSSEAPVGKGRRIRSVLAHVHNVRCLWLEAHASEEAPAKVDRESVTVEELRAALATSAACLRDMLRAALEGGGALRGFKPDAVGFLAYAIAHEAHHRGQVCMLARLLGKPLPRAAGYELWNWRARAAEARPATPASP